MCKRSCRSETILEQLSGAEAGCLLKVRLQLLHRPASETPVCAIGAQGTQLLTVSTELTSANITTLTANECAEVDLGVHLEVWKPRLV